jgi:hypothetical protein
MGKPTVTKSLSRWQNRRNLKKAVDAHMSDINRQAALNDIAANYQSDEGSGELELSNVSEEPGRNVRAEPEHDSIIVERCDESIVNDERSQREFGDFSDDDEYFDSNSSISCDEAGYESDSGGDQDDDGEDLRDFLRQWGLQNNITQSALTELLKGLKRWHPDLPSDARTLLHTPASVEIEKMGDADGSFYNFGLSESLQKHLESTELVPDCKVLQLNFNVDGLPISGSSNAQLWPILCLVEEDISHTPFPVALFCGTSKPPVKEYLSDFVRDLKDLIENGFIFKESRFEVCIRAFICDTPAKAFMKCTKAHNGFFGCDGCTQKGEYWDHRLIFLEQDAPVRTDQSFVIHENEAHHKGTSPLEDLGVGLISTFPLDPMHLVYLGVTKRLLNAWKSGPRPTRLLSRSINVISDRLVDAKKFWPYEFGRKPRSVSEMDKWKAVEFRQFLLYLGPVVLRGVLSDEQYSNFMLFSVAMMYLVSKRLWTFHDYADELLRAFVSHAAELYGRSFVVYNVHSLIHLSRQVGRLGPAETFSAFPFENYLGQIKRLLRTGNKPLQQVCRRLMERVKYSDSDSAMYSQMTEIPSSYFTPENGKVLGLNGKYFKKVRGPHFRLFSENMKDSCVFLKNGHIVRLFYFVRHESGSLLLLCKRFRKRENFFEYPCDSSKLSIFFVRELSENLCTYNICEIDCKAVCLPYKAGFVCMPMHHL